MGDCMSIVIEWGWKVVKEKKMLCMLEALSYSGGES
jgi:hypothetical protein